MTYQHCSNNEEDRNLGKYWEEQFCKLAMNVGKSFTAHQIGRSGSAVAWSTKGGKPNADTLPDITVWTCPGEHHEVKHKAPTRHGGIGLEEYRLQSLVWFAKETRQSVQYTIHRHDLAGGRTGTVNLSDHWFTIDVLKMEQMRIDGDAYGPCPGKTYINGNLGYAPIWYWPATSFVPLEEFWGVIAW